MYTGDYIYMYLLLRDEEGRKKEARSNTQTTIQHTQGTKKNELPQMHAQVAECVSVAVTVT